MQKRMPPQLRKRKHRDPRVILGSKKQDRKSLKQLKGQAKAQRVVESYCRIVNYLFGAIIFIFAVAKYAEYMENLHENELGFSNIKEIEREISFRTEQGLYYSFYKHLVNAHDFWEGYQELLHDNKTEHGRTINAFERFNIYQEFILAAIYKYHSFGLAPIFFYIRCIFLLHGLFLGVIFLTAWSIAGSWITGFLAVAFFVFNRPDVTRVNYTVPLRESFSLPFLYAQFYAIGIYMWPSTKESREKPFIVVLYLLTFLFTVTWHFAQFLLLIQSVVLFCLGAMWMLDKRKVTAILLVQAVALLTVWYIQFYQQMILSSFVLSFIPVVLYMLKCRPSQPYLSLCGNLVWSVVVCVATPVIAFLLNGSIRILLNVDEDDHIYNFTKNKFFEDPTDFDTRLYLCNAIFQSVDSDTLQRLTQGLLLPSYLLVLFLYLMGIVLSVLFRWSEPRPNSMYENNMFFVKVNDEDVGKVITLDSLKTDYSDKDSDDSEAISPVSALRREIFAKDACRSEDSDELDNIFTELRLRPDLTYHIGISLPLALMAAAVLRMKFVWGPHACILASVGITDDWLWNMFRFFGMCESKAFLSFIKYLLAVSILIALIYSFLMDHSSLPQFMPTLAEELEQLMEFYDPDTVELMKWISSKTPPSSAFAGSMQLLAAVKLCTGRAITNHPHFENKWLRERTKQIYQIYAKQPPDLVHKILREANASYVILEDSICLTAHHGQCSLPHIMDVVNGHFPEVRKKDPNKPHAQLQGRFCDEVRYATPRYSKYFKSVFENRTFRVYRVVSRF